MHIMNYADKADNVYLIDTKMFGFDNYNAAYIVAGKKIVLIDTGLPNQLEAVLAGIRAHGFSPADISNILITHCHGDHCGNTAPLLRENPESKVYIHPAGLKQLTDPAGERAKLKGLLLPKMIERFGTAEPVPESRIEFFNDGDVFDLGDGVRLEVIFAPGHQPSGTVILEEKNMGLFINDLVGNYFIDADFSLNLNPYGSDVLQAMESLRKCLEMPLKRLFLGHYGISENPKEVIQLALNSMQKLLDIGAQCIAEGKPEEIEPRITAMKLPEAEKLIKTRGKALYDYIVEELIPHQSTAFAEYYIKHQLK
jgi:glyoxylase-like metal-dependent hydrolase (beta-lactamase superfamily II)